MVQWLKGVFKKKPCASCEVLKEQCDFLRHLIDEERAEKAKLLEIFARDNKIPVEEVLDQTTNEPMPMIPKYTSWRMKAESLTQASFERNRKKDSE